MLCVLKRTSSFEYSLHMFWLRNKKFNFQLHSLFLRPEKGDDDAIIRVGSRMVSIRIHCTEKWQTSFHNNV